MSADGNQEQGGMVVTLEQCSLPFSLEEVRVLIAYTTERGIDPESSILGPLNKAVCDYAQAPATSCCDKANEVIKWYSKLAKLTSPVNGRTLFDTARLVRNLAGLVFYSILFLVLVLGNEVMSAWFNDMVLPEEGKLLWLINLQKYVLDKLSPFFWGGLGACVYLLKRLTDLAGDQAFDRRQLQGWQTRMWLGAILGAVIQYLYDPAMLSDTQVKLSVKAIAFLTGIGVKVVYGAIEKTLDLLAQKMNLSAIRGGERKQAVVRQFLNKELSQTDPEKEKSRYDLINSMIAGLEKEADA